MKKAHERGADAIILDLEDGVPPGLKEEARASLPESVGSVRSGGASVVVRVNRPWRQAWQDVEAAVLASADGLLFPKVERAAQLSVLVEYLEELEVQHGSPRLAVLICLESALGVANAHEILSASSRVDSVIPGVEDLGASLKAEPSRELITAVFAPALVAARAAGAALIGTLGRSVGFQDLEAFRDLVEHSKGWGFQGVTCIHPAQVQVANEVFQPSPESLEAARRIVEAFEAGNGDPVAVDGEMVDRPVYLRAKRVLDPRSQ